MHFLLVNQHPAVSRLITLSTKKLEFNIDEATSFEELPLESYDIVFVDNEMYDESAIDKMREVGLSRHFVCITPRGETKPENMDYLLKKPFLPTDFIDLALKIGGEIENEVFDDRVLEELEEEDAQTSDTQEINLEDEDISELDLGDIELDCTDDIELETKEESMEADDAELSCEASDLQSYEDEIELDEEMLKRSDEENVASQTSGEDELDSILDSEEIDEVKQLLEDEADNDLLLEESTSSEEDFSVNEPDDEELSLDDVSLCEDSVVEDSPPSSIDDIKESELLVALGGEQKCCEKIDLEKKIEQKVSQSIKDTLNDNSLKDVLKGMKINVTVTFEEDSQ